ncbi:hypothetical protein N431DRAFT_438142 [Stipitochalara longipes BDJ]|nr:hypothetical protein N431DRAFT_438142 [Stipitochalara longipes BDJ]
MPSSVVEEPVVTPQQQGCILDGNGTKRIQGALALRGHSYPQNEPTGQTRQQPENNGQRLAQEYPQQHQPGAFAQIETSHERCSVFGENSQTKQHNGHLGIPLVAKATYTDCQVVGKGAQFNGSASGEHGLELAKSFFGSGKS